MLTHPPRHRQASKFARSGLFKDLNTFNGLEQRIAALATEKERGDAFEVFVEAYLSIDEIMQAAEVWVTGAIPIEIERQLNLPPNDYGCDGVFRTRQGELVTYQVKFRSDRSSLPYAELATFFGISEKADRRVVLTNSTAISKVAESRTSFQTTRGGDFDRLDAAQFAAISDWIDGVTPAPAVREPRAHQRAALADIERALVNHDRATIVMACGTGKTLVALWAAESADPKRVLVLVPSLNLLRQTVHEWAKWTNWGDRFRYLCVCSDAMVSSGLDDIRIRPEEADFPVRTDPAIVRRFLEGDSGAALAISVVFCTYQSAPVVGQAVNGLQPFDLGIFDEAHKTTGRESTRYGFALKDANLSIRKRLFFTATPRHIDIRKRDKEGDFAIASMDDEAIYGPIAHRLSFSEASKQKIIVPYKVVISVVDSEMIDNALLDRSEVAVDGEPVRAKWVAHQIALKRAVAEHDVKRIITFHSSINAAAAFAAEGTGGVGFHLCDFQLFHVSGAQPTALRAAQMRAFAHAPRGVITNARCLTEGIDVPSVDMVAFMNPRKSRVDIVQAVGRAMRTSGTDKTHGYVLVPLFLELRQGESLTEALVRSDFDEIAQVLSAMRDSDDELSDIIQELNVEKGVTGSFDESRLREKIEVLGQGIRLSELAIAIRTLLLSELGTSWDERFGQLVAYKAKYGDCSVPAEWAENPALASWCNNQRYRYKDKKVPQDRIARLEKLGFIWEQLAEIWEQNFAALVAYKTEHGNCNVPQNWAEPPRLGVWCNTQRHLYKSKRLPPDRIDRLEKLGFVWDLSTDAWEKLFAELVAYKNAHGDCSVPLRYKENPQLGLWCGNQRAKHRRGDLSSNRTSRLEQLDFVWDPFTSIWDDRFAELAAYKKIYGNCNVPDRYDENPELGRWCRAQRTANKKNRLSPDRIKRLEQLGFIWERLAAEWEENFEKLVAYKAKRGDCNVPSTWAEDPPFGAWCTSQRTRYKSKTIYPDRVKRLEQLGFVWYVRPLIWEQYFAELEDYCQTHGNCDVPQAWSENPSLGAWCNTQRKAYKSNKLSSDHIVRLEQLGFVWAFRPA
jgi:superfamily II DNA or RNA helicase